MSGPWSCPNFGHCLTTAAREQAHPGISDGRVRAGGSTFRPQCAYMGRLAGGFKFLSSLVFSGEVHSPLLGTNTFREPLGLSGALRGSPVSGLCATCSSEPSRQLRHPHPEVRSEAEAQGACPRTLSGDARRPCVLRTAQAAFAEPSSAQMAESAWTSPSMSASLCIGEGVILRRSVPRGTVG